MRAVARMLTMLPRLLDADLVREQQISLSTYLVLMNLSEADERRLRMSELAAICDLSLSGLTRIVDKLEASGFVERQRDAEDARVLRAHHPWRPRRQTPGLGAVHRVTLPPARPRKADRLRWAIRTFSARPSGGSSADSPGVRSTKPTAGRPGEDDDRLHRRPARDGKLEY